jgi:hypothetical protein
MCKKLGCDACEGGEIFLYYKDEESRTIRCDFVYCGYCHPGNTSRSSPRQGEEEIPVEEFTRLSEQGWKSDDI